MAEEYGILQHVRFNTCVTKAVFDTSKHCWLVHTTQGVFTARFLINGNGYFSDEPYVPVFKDAERFKGEIIHTSHLDGQRTFAGKKVVLVGSGSTAICCAPELAAACGSLLLLQRSPSYIYEISNRAGPLIRSCQKLYMLGIRAPVKWLRHYLQLRDDLIFVEAKGATNWSTRQIESKGRRLGRLFGEKGDRVSGVVPYFVLASPVQSVRLNKANVPAWMKIGRDT